MKTFWSSCFLFFKLGALPASAVFLYVIFISIFGFVHFHLDHDMFTINSWITENKWLMVCLIKAIVWICVIYWTAQTNPTVSLVKHSKLFLVGAVDSLPFLFFNLCSILFFVYYERIDSIDFNIRIFLNVALFYILDLTMFHFIEIGELKKWVQFILVLFLCTFNAIFLNITELFEPALLICYLLAFASGLFILFSRRVSKSLILMNSFGGIAFFCALTYRVEQSGKYLVSIRGSHIDAMILFLSLGIAHYFFISLRSKRLLKLN